MNPKQLKTSIACILVCLFLEACSHIPAIPAKGEVFGESVETTVDSEMARHYLESHLQINNKNSDIDQQISTLQLQHKNTLPSRQELKEISQTYSVDFASLFLADRLLSHECNKMLNTAFADYLKNDTPIDKSSLDSYLVLFVPGWNYVENGHLTGADFAEPRKLATALGLENYLVALVSTGSVEENADVLAAEVLKYSRSGKKIILAGASSAGPVIHLTLGERLDRRERGAVKAWINLGGILQGSPLIDYLQERPQVWLFELVAWLKDWNKEAILSMATNPSRNRFSRLQIGSDILVINYVGVPLSGQLSRFSKGKYPLLRPEGPNDGLTLLTDAIAPDSLTIVALGSDHFFAEDPQINAKTLALMKLVITYLETGAAMRCKVTSES